MKVLTIMGSPRKNATSTIIAEHFNQEASTNGADVKTFHLNALDYKGCQGCYACKTGQESCILTDDLIPVFEALNEADAVVITSPIYFGDVTSQLKGFFDRLFSTVAPEYLTTGIPKSRLASGKKSLLIFTQGAEETRHEEIPERYDNYLAMSGFGDRRIIRECGRIDFTDTTPRENSLTMAKAAAREFANA